MKASSLFLSSLLLSAGAVGADLAPEPSSQSPALTGAAPAESAASIDRSVVAPSDELVLATDVWPLVGEARLKVLIWEVYDSALYTPSGRWQGEPPYQLSLHYLRDIPAAKLIEETDKAWQEQGRNLSLIHI